MIATIAESVTQAAQSWPGAATVIVVTVGGWVTAWIKQRGTGNTLKEVKNQVSNGHDTNLRDDVTEGLSLMRVAVEHVRQLPTNDDITKINRKLDGLGRSIDTERKARRSLEDRFRVRFPDETPL